MNLAANSKRRNSWSFIFWRRVRRPSRSISFSVPENLYIGLRDQVKSGQRGSGQNRPTDVARDMVLLSHLLLIRQVCFRSPTPWSAFQDVTVVQQTVEHAHRWLARCAVE